MPENYLEKFKKLLAELFMFDQADLDFGIYRIMNAKRGEIT
jgi:adenine-specific DNA-methyltransferase